MRSLNFPPSRTLLLPAIAFAATLFGQKITVTDPSPSLSNSKDITVSGRMMSLALSPNGKRVYAGSSSGGVWRSNDGGIKWEQLTFDLPGDSRSTCVDAEPGSCSLPAVSVPDVVVSPVDPDLVFAAIIGDSWQGTPKSRDGIYRSDDGGETWKRVFQFKGDGCDQHQLALAPDDPKLLWAAGGCGVAISAPGADGKVGTASTWTLVDLPNGIRILRFVIGPAETAACMAVATQDSITPPTAATNFKPIATAKPVTGALLVSGGRQTAGSWPLCPAGPIWFTSHGIGDRMVLHISIAVRTPRRVCLA